MTRGARCRRVCESWRLQRAELDLVTEVWAVQREGLDDQSEVGGGE